MLEKVEKCRCKWYDRDVILSTSCDWASVNDSLAIVITSISTYHMRLNLTILFIICERSEQSEWDRVTVIASESLTETSPVSLTSAPCITSSLFTPCLRPYVQMMRWGDIRTKRGNHWLTTVRCSTWKPKAWKTRSESLIRGSSYSLTPFIINLVSPLGSPCNGSNDKWKGMICEVSLETQHSLHSSPLRCARRSDMLTKEMWYVGIGPYGAVSDEDVHRSQRRELQIE